MQKPTQYLQRSATLPWVEMRSADRSCACYHTHSHDEFSFGVIDAGEADYRNLGQKNHIGAGDTVTINPGDAHACNPKAGNWSYRMLFVDADWVGQLQQEMLASHHLDYLPFTKLYEREAHTYQAFNGLFETLATESNALAAETLLIQFLEKRFLPVHALGSAPEKADLHRIERVKELIMDQLDENLSLNEYSAHCGLSRYHLIRSFKQAYGLSPHAFQLDQRINRAKSLLKQGRSIVDTASLLGFADQSHFQRNFKKRLAVTPKQYQGFFV